MIRWATVTDVTAKGVWVVSAWLTGRTGPIPVSGNPAVGDPVLIVRTDEGELAAVRGGDTRYLPLTGGTIAGSLYIGNNGLRLWIDGSFAALSAAGYNVSVRAGLTELNIGYSAAAGSGYVSTNRQTQAAHPANALATKGYVDAIKADVKAIAAASTSFADFQTRMAAW